jgi:hypothetical protein
VQSAGYRASPRTEVPKRQIRSLGASGNLASSWKGNAGQEARPAAAAVGFLIAGAPLTKQAAAAAGFALVTRAVDVTQERRRDKAAAQERRRSDLDETRRVAYMALIAGESRHYELVATVANALAHHGMQVPFPEAAAHLARVASGDTEGESARWLQQQIDRLTVTLDDENNAPPSPHPASDRRWPLRKDEPSSAIARNRR